VACARDEIIRAIEKVPSEVVKRSCPWGNVEDVINIMEEHRKTGVQTVVFWNLTVLGAVTEAQSSFSCIVELVSRF